jgi:hypothetical protein
VAKPMTTMEAAERDPYAHREHIWRRWSALKAERASWDSHAKELAKFLLPRASRFTTSETNKGHTRHNAIYDNTGLRAVRILAAGMMSGMTSPARPWFRLKHADDDLMEYEPVKVWCAKVTRMLLDAFAKSNIYRVLHQCYGEQGVFGTHASIIMPHPKRLLHGTSLTFGEYAIATDADGQVDTLYRECRMTAGALVDAFGYERCSRAVQTAWDRGHVDSWHDVIHAMEPRRKPDPSKLDPKNMPFKSCWFEQGGPKGDYLRESGFRRFRGLAPRWNVTGQDIYGESPGMEALGDVKQLQHEQYRKAQAIDYQTKPPVALPTAAKGQETNMLPGGVTYMDTPNGNMGQRNLFDVNLQLDHLLADIMDVRGRVNSAFYADLFLMISSLAGQEGIRTAFEIAELHEEKLLMLGPVLERQQNELIDPLIDMGFEQLTETGMLPPPPPELEGQPLETELLGILAQAQRVVQTKTIDRFMAGVGQVAALGKPEVADKINGDMAVEIYGDSLGVDPRILNDDEAVAAIRQARAKANAEAMERAAAQQEAETAKALGGVPTQGGASNLATDSLGADPIGAFSGYGSPQAERLVQ